MASVAITQDQPNKKSVSYEDLTTLALDSAIALENLLQERSVDTSVINELFSALQEAPGIGVSTTQGVQHISPTALAVYTRALRHASHEPVQTRDDITTKILALIGNFEREKASTNLLPSIRDFCLSLHDALLLETYAIEHDNWEERERGSAVSLR